MEADMKFRFTVASMILGMIVALGPSASAQSGTVLWTYDAGATILSSPALGPDGAVYFGTSSGLYAVTNTGSSASNQWIFAAEITSSSPAIAVDGTTYFCSGDGKLHALTPSGAEKWSYTVGCAGGSPAIGIDGTVYVGGSFVYSVSPSGVLRWKSPASANSCSSPAIGPDGTIYVGYYGDSALFAFARDGILKWVRGPSPVLSDSPALAAGGAVYAAEGALRAFAPDGTQVWSTATNWFDGSPVVGSGGTVYLRSFTDHFLYAIVPGGQFLWGAAQEPAQHAPATAPAVDATGRIYHCASNSVIALTQDGQVAWSVYGGTPSLPGSWYANTSPTIGPDGTIYAALGTKLYAITSGTNGPARSSWPMYRHDSRHTGSMQTSLLESPKKRSDANFQFELYAQQLGQSYTIETSTNLNNWTSLTSVVATTLPTDVADLTATNSSLEFYRASSPP